MENFHATTIIAVKKGGIVVMAGDGQVSTGNTILKSNAVKIRRIYEESILVGFAGATADAFTLMEKFEIKLNEFSGNLLRSCVELAKDWRMDKILRRLEAMMLTSDGKQIFLLTGNGDVIEPKDDVIAIGSGGNYALAAGKALLQNTKEDAESIARKSLEIAAEICVFTNKNIILEKVVS